MELTKKEIARALDTPAPAAGGVADPGTQVERFDPVVLARVLEHEAGKAQTKDLTHLAVKLALVDAIALAAFLRRGALLGA